MHTICIRENKDTGEVHGTIHVWTLSRGNLSLRFPTEFYSDQPAQPETLAKGLKFWIKKLERRLCILSMEWKTGLMVSLLGSATDLCLCLSHT